MEKKLKEKNVGAKSIEELIGKFNISKVLPPTNNGVFSIQSMEFSKMIT